MPRTIQPTEHVFIAGATGSGKSVCADVFTAGMPETVIKLDIKDDTGARRMIGEPVWRGLEENEDFVVLHRLDDVFQSDMKKIIYVPPMEEKTMEHYDLLAKYVYDSGFTRLWVDELMLMTESASKFPPYLREISVAGRARRATLLTCTQRPFGIPQIILSNSQHFFVFRLTNNIDRSKMAMATGCKQMLTNPKEHAFWYYLEGEPPEDVRQFRLNIGG